MRKRIVRSRRINLDLLYSVASAAPEETGMEDDFYDDYDPDEYEMPEQKKLIPDGETEFLKTFKQGEDF